MLRRVKARGAAILVLPRLLWTIVPSAIVLNHPIVFVLPVAPMLAGKSSRLKARKRRLAKLIVPQTTTCDLFGIEYPSYSREIWAAMARLIMGGSKC
jgi:hypothetical protein